MKIQPRNVSPCRQVFRTLLVILLLSQPCLITGALNAADPLRPALEDFRKARGRAIARENQVFLQWLEGALSQARQQKRMEEAARIESLMEQLRTETAALLKAGDTRALLPANEAQLRVFLTGTSWRPDIKGGEMRVFTEDGFFKSKAASTPYVIINARRVSLIWSSSTRIDCEFNEDYTAMKELGGMRHVWHRAR